jgi:hypothetical protein
MAIERQTNVMGFILISSKSLFIVWHQLSLAYFDIAKNSLSLARQTAPVTFI